MIKEITQREIPLELLPHLVTWQKYLTTAIELAPFTGINWPGEDKNMIAHNSKEAYIEWFTASPPYSEPYRDKHFYPRELTMLSSWAKPYNIVEMGTNLGMGTKLLALLNPIAVIVTIDNKTSHKHEKDQDYPVGHLISGRDRVIMRNHESWDYMSPRTIDLCFIDADHTAESVKKDSETAWLNRSSRHRWAIAWHDYNPDKPTFVDYSKAIEEFTNEKGITAYHFNDSATLWTYGG